MFSLQWLSGSREQQVFHILWYSPRKFTLNKCIWKAHWWCFSRKIFVFFSFAPSSLILLKEFAALSPCTVSFLKKLVKTKPGFYRRIEFFVSLFSWLSIQSHSFFFPFYRCTTIYLCSSLFVDVWSFSTVMLSRLLQWTSDSFIFYSVFRNLQGSYLKERFQKML